MTTSVHGDLALAGQLDEGFDAGDVAAVDTLFAADLVDHTLAPGAPTAIDGMRALVASVGDDFTGTAHEILYQVNHR